MFLGIARVTLSFPAAGSLKDKRQILRKLLDRMKARFNVSVAEVGSNDLWQLGIVGLAVVANSHRFANEAIDTIVHFIEESYLAPITDRTVEILSVGDAGYGSVGIGHGGLSIDPGNRTLAEAEGLSQESSEEWDDPDLADTDSEEGEP
jgi:uncharacterized protein YlxP (DUF503 family)